MKKQKKRLDHVVAQRYPEYSRRQIQSWIMQGKVLVDDQPVTKPGGLVDTQASIILKAQPPKYVSRAGYKLEKALEHFEVDVSGLTVLDAGLSTGGFTDCLLKSGAAKVYGIDVGYGQAHEALRQDSRVVVKERTNLKDVAGSEFVDLVTLDLSFISVLKVMDVVRRILKPGGELIVLIKPQFEAGRHEVGAGGIVRDSQTHQRVIKGVTQGIESYGFTCHGVTESPILGAEGNKEFLTYCTKRETNSNCGA